MNWNVWRVVLSGIVGWGLVGERSGRAAELRGAGWRFEITDTTGVWRLKDERSGVTWGVREDRARFGEVTVRTGGRTRSLPLVPSAVSTEGRSVRLEFSPDPENPAARLRGRVGVVVEGEREALEFAYEADARLGVESVRLLDDALTVTDQERGYVVVPVREGLLIPADSGKTFEHRFDTYAYEGCHMRMAGLVKNGSALLVTWDDPYMALDVRGVAPKPDAAAGIPRRLSASVVARKSARSVRLQVLGPGGYLEIGRAYRDVARRAGLVVTMDEKIRGNPVRERYLGATNFKLWSLLDRRMNEDCTRELSVRTNWTFAEAGDVAEHLKNDLRLDRVLFTMGGWIHRGYDNQHPDILPAAPECGGDAGLTECARRVMAQGYLFCLHDNYQDIYRDSPSWSERWIGKNADGSLTGGGSWAGGRAYLTCSRMALELARRPRNLPAVRQLTGANSYFIDTTYAAGLGECYDPEHPLSRGDDLRWKVALSDYAREVFGTFGSECGREWAIPHSDFFEGLTGVSGRAYHDAGLVAKLGAIVVPLFEVVYRDCIAMYGKYGYDPAHAADYVLAHAAFGRPLHHHNVPAHRYWLEAGGDDVVPLVPSVAAFEAVGPREFRVRYRWNVEGRVDAGWRVFVHFVDGADHIVFQNDHELPAVAFAGTGGSFETGPFTVRVPESAAGSLEMGVGLFVPASGRRARLPIAESDERRHALGTLRVREGEVAFTAAAARPRGGTAADPGMYQRGDGGWTAGMHPYDRFVKNTHEILSPLHELTGRQPLTAHEFLDGGRRVQRSVFGEGPDATVVVVNGGDVAVTRNSTANGEVTIPPFGLMVEGPRFVAVVATRWGGRDYAGPVLFTLRSLDDAPLARSRRVRVFHGFGDPDLDFRGKRLRVEREVVVEFPAGRTFDASGGASPR